jgi:phage FluMu protein Com
MAVLSMRRVREGEVPPGGGTAVQEDPDLPVFRGNGSDDYVCVECGNVLASAMDPEYMDFKVRVKCGRCRTVNVPDTNEEEDRERWRKRRSDSGR